VLDKNLIESKLTNILENSEIFLVELKIINNSNKIQIKLDKYSNLGLDDCALIHRQLYNELETIYEDFELEISSPGLSAPFKVIEQYKKNIDKKVEIYTKDGRTLIATIISVDETKNEILIQNSKKEINNLNLSEINKTKLVISFK